MNSTDTVYLSLAEIFGGITSHFQPETPDLNDLKELQQLTKKINSLQSKFGNDGQTYVARLSLLVSRQNEILQSNMLECKKLQSNLKDLLKNLETRHLQVRTSLVSTTKSEKRLSYLLRNDLKSVFRESDKLLGKSEIQFKELSEDEILKEIPTNIEFEAYTSKISNVLISSFTGYAKLVECQQSGSAKIRQFLENELPKSVNELGLVFFGTPPSSALGTFDLAEIAGSKLAFLAHTKPPTLNKLKCSDAVVLFLNVAEDIADGSVGCGKHTDLIKTLYGDFLNHLTSLDEAVCSLFSLANEARESFQVIQSIKELPSSVKSCLNYSTIKSESSRLNRELEKQKAQNKRELEKQKARIKKADQLIANAIPLAQLGNTEKAMEKCKSAVSLAGAKHVSRELLQRVESIAKQEEMKFSQATSLLSAIKQECIHHTSGIRKFFGSNRDKLRAKLQALAKLLPDLKWAAGSSLANNLAPHFETVPLAVELSNLSTFKIPIWLAQTQLMKKLSPRQIKPELIFLNALCAMAAGDRDFSKPEKNLIISIVEKEIPGVFDISELNNLFAKWQETAKTKDAALNNAQRIVDLDGILNADLRMALQRQLVTLSKADGTISLSEKANFDAMTARLL